MTNESLESHDKLHEQLSAAEQGGSGGARISRSASRFGGRYAAIMASLLASYLLVVVYVYPRRIAWLDITVTAAFVVSMVGANLWYGRRRRGSSRGWARRYQVAFAFSVGLFGLGLALADMMDTRSLWLWLPYSVLTALPLVAVGLLRGTR
ncbi:MAG TPA: hypothetical protein VIQ26_06635 [Microbacteriaceae bacterium]